MTEPRRYRFKPAALKQPASYALDADRLQADDGWELRLAEVDAAAFVNHVMQGARMMRLDLWVAGERRSLSYTGAANAWQSDPDAATFLRLARDTLRALDGATTGLRIALGETGRARWGMFIIGLVSALGGIAIFVAALASGISQDRLAAAAVPMLVLAAMGGILTVRYGPWRKPPMATPAALAGVIDGIVGTLPERR
ncbi:hypothetical protein [Sinisalibacter aestuarii]|uniref:Uncharacterized protein n=1 Tax=Sinisalibacter aestuarii TaxID=2949426 RepID=A0ABQ5LRL7_9RHOB|nr:hypothetical protein [Sinisalibacter aestuarii]GKY87258.1 hypothetical protein STA1M1_11270 [Sinisalibacter aestuarii]